MKRVAIATLGCKTNQFESAALLEQFSKAGYATVPFTEPADIYVINSCTVTARTDAETRRLIRRARRLNPQARIVATGCYAQVSPAELARMPEVDVVLGNQEKLDSRLVAEASENSVGDVSQRAHLAPLELNSFAEHTRAFLQVQNGCDSFCSYCIVPYARGRSRSVPPAEVVAGIQRLLASGFREVVLTGIHLGAYGLDLTPATSLTRLIRRVLGETNLLRLRIGSVDPNEFSDELLNLCATAPAICHHFHIPLQSGCDAVLRRMKRPYDTAFIRDLLSNIRSSMPRAFIGSDVIAGFPGESERDFEDTCQLLQTLPLADLHVFPYSKRPGTEAATMPGHLRPDEINRRAARVREIAANHKKRFLDGFLGLPILALGQSFDETTGIVRGMSREYFQVEYPGSASDLNREIRLEVTAIAQGQASGRRFGAS